MGLMDNDDEAAGYGTQHSADLGVLEDGLYVYHVQCEDTSDNWMEHSKTVVFYVNTDSQYCYTAALKSGWNSFFLPELILDDINFNCGADPYVENVLASVEGQYSIVYYFDGESWLFYDPAYPEFSTLTEFNDQVSSPYYIYMESPGRIELVCEEECQACGNGIPEGEEQCDYGEDNGILCVPPYGSSCQYCSYGCATVTVYGGYCGDEIVQQEEDEQCELPDTGNNEYCLQDTERCYLESYMVQYRDAFGDCDETCGCIEDNWGDPVCEAGKCGAECATNGDCLEGTCIDCQCEYMST
jgi:hypothetical protein